MKLKAPIPKKPSPPAAKASDEKEGADGLPPRHLYNMTTIKAQIAQLEAQIAAQEKTLQALEGEIDQIEREFTDFELRFNQVVKPVSDRLDAAKDALQKLLDLKRQREWGANDEGIESLWKGSDSVFGFEPYSAPASTNGHSDEERIQQKPAQKQPQTLKQLYRKLARLYHPDYAQNEEDRLRRNQIMGMINEAYQVQDMDALRALEKAVPDIQDGQASPLPLDVMRLRQLQKTYYDLAEQIRDLESHRNQLIHNHMMDLKIQTKVAQVKGRDLLREIAADMEREYWDIMQRMDQIRSSL